MAQLELQRVGTTVRLRSLRMADSPRLESRTGPDLHNRFQLIKTQPPSSNRNLKPRHSSTLNLLKM